MGFVLLVVACLSGDPALCASEQLALPGVTTETGCYLAGRLRLQEWMDEHAERELTDVRCLAASQDARIVAAAVR